MSKTVGKARLLVITLTMKFHGSRVGKSKRVKDVLSRVEDWYEVKFTQLAPGVYVTEKRHSVNKLRAIAQVIEEELPGATVFLVKKPAPRAKEVTELPYLPTDEVIERKKEEMVIEWEGRIREDHGVWYISVPKEVKQVLQTQYGVQKGSRVRVRFVSKVM